MTGGTFRNNPHRESTDKDTMQCTMQQFLDFAIRFTSYIKRFQREIRDEFRLVQYREYGTILE